MVTVASRWVPAVGGPADGADWRVRVLPARLTDMYMSHERQAKVDGLQFLPDELVYLHSSSNPDLRDREGNSVSGWPLGEEPAKHFYFLHAATMGQIHPFHFGQEHFGISRSRRMREEGIMGTPFPIYVWQGSDDDENDYEWENSTPALWRHDCIGREMREKAIDEVYRKAEAMWRAGIM